jgi:hypothetical protein
MKVRVALLVVSIGSLLAALVCATGVINTRGGGPTGGAIIIDRGGLSASAIIIQRSGPGSGGSQA